MGSAAGGGGVNEDAGGKRGAIGYFSTGLCRQVGVGSAGDGDLDAARRKHGAQMIRKLEGKVFFEQIGGKARACVASPVSGVKQDCKCWNHIGRWRRWNAGCS